MLLRVLGPLEVLGRGALCRSSPPQRHCCRINISRGVTARRLLIDAFVASRASVGIKSPPGLRLAARSLPAVQINHRLDRYT